MIRRGRYVLHVDGTCEEGSRVSARLHGLLSGQVLDSRKIGSEGKGGTGRPRRGACRVGRPSRRRPRPRTGPVPGGGRGLSRSAAVRLPLPPRRGPREGRARTRCRPPPQALPGGEAPPEARSGRPVAPAVRRGLGRSPRPGLPARRTGSEGGRGRPSEATALGMIHGRSWILAFSRTGKATPSRWTYPTSNSTNGSSPHTPSSPGPARPDNRAGTGWPGISTGSAGSSPRWSKGSGPPNSPASPPGFA